MPSSSAKQSRFMAAVAHSPSFAKKVGVSQSVGKDFNTADKGKTFNRGGMMKKRRFDEGGDVSDYEIDPDSRRAHGLYDEKPAAKKTSKKATKNSAALDAELTREALAREKARDVAAKRNYEKDVRPGLDMAEMSSPAGTNMGLRTKDMRNFAKGGMMKESKAMVGKEVMFMKKKGAPASMIKHEKSEMGMAKGGMSYAKGGGIESRGKTKGTMVRMASGGSVGSASRRADGIAQRGKTRC